MKTKELKFIKESPLFNATWYLAQNPDVAKAGVDPAKHYLEYGWKERRNPSPDFDGNAYLVANPDVSKAKVCPLLHFIKHGKKEGRTFIPGQNRPGRITPPPKANTTLSLEIKRISESPLFNATWYLTQNPDVAKAGLDPATHYLKYGWKEQRNPSPEFDGNAYLAANPDVSKAKICPLLHFIKHGKKEGRVLRLPPCALPSNFSGELYLAMNPDLSRARINPAEHYLRAGKREKRYGATYESVVSTFGEIKDPERKTCVVVSHEASRTGAPINAWNIARILKNRFNFNVCSIILSENGEIEENFKAVSDLAVIFSNRARFNDEAIKICLKQVLDKTEIEFALVNSICSRATLPYFTERNIPALLFIHEFAYYLSKEELEYGFLWATDVVFSSKTVMDCALKKVGTSHRFRVLPQGKSIAPEHQYKASGEFQLLTALTEYKKRGDTIVLGVGQVSYRKGCDLFIRVAAKIRDKIPQRKIHFVWLGDGYDPDKNFFSKMLQSQIILFGLEDSLSFSGVVYKVNDFYRLADLLLLPSILDPLPGVVIESIASGVPVVCFNKCSGFPEMFSSYGLFDTCVANYLDETDMAEKSGALLTDKALRKVAIDAFLKLFRENFTMEKYVERILKMIPTAKQAQLEDFQKARQAEKLAITKNGVSKNDFLLTVRAKKMGVLHQSTIETDAACYEKFVPVIFGIKKEVPIENRRNAETVIRSVGGNMGNLAFHYAIDSILGFNHADTFSWADCASEKFSPGTPSFESIAGQKKWKCLRSDGEKTGLIGIFPLANQLGPHCAALSSMVDRLRATKIPLIGIGLGAQSKTHAMIPQIPQGVQEWVKAIADHAPSKAPNISLRGEFTRRVMEKIGLADHAEVLGCPTLFINPDLNLGKLIGSNIREPQRIAYASAHPYWHETDTLMNSLSEIITEEHNGDFVVQSDVRMIKLAMGEFDSLTEQEQIRIKTNCRKNLQLPEFKSWANAHAKIFFNIPQWMDFYRQYDFVIGPRIHGIMLAIQAGVPALCVAIDTRTTELCETMKIPYVPLADVAEGIAKKDLLKHFKFSPDEFDDNRKMLAKRFITFLNNNRIVPTNLLYHIAQIPNPNSVVLPQR